MGRAAAGAQPPAEPLQPATLIGSATASGTCRGCHGWVGDWMVGWSKAGPWHLKGMPWVGRPLDGLMEELVGGLINCNGQRPLHASVCGTLMPIPPPQNRAQGKVGTAPARPAAPAGDAMGWLVGPWSLVRLVLGTNAKWVAFECVGLMDVYTL